MNREDIKIGQRLWWRDGGTVRYIVVELMAPIRCRETVGRATGFGGIISPDPDDLYPTESAACDAAYARLLEDAEIMKDRAWRTRQREDSSVESHLTDSDWLFDRCKQLGAASGIIEVWPDDLRAAFIRREELRPAIADNERIERRMGRETP